MDMERQGLIWEMIFKVTPEVSKSWPTGQIQPTFFTAFINKVLLEHNQAHLSVAVFML